MKGTDVRTLRRILPDGVWHSVDPASDKTACGIPRTERERTVSATQPGRASGVTCKRCQRTLTP